MRALKDIKKLLSLLIFAVLVGLVFYAYERGSRTSAESLSTNEPTQLTNAANSMDPLPSASTRTLTQEIGTPKANAQAVQPISMDVVNKSPTTLQAEVKKMSIPEFRQLAKESLRTLPRTKDVKGLKDKDVHHMSPEIFTMSRSLMTIAGAVESNPELEKDAIIYYKKCVDTKSILLTVRGRCLSNYKRIGEKHGIIVNLSDYPPELARLAEFIP
ncbi:MAG: hypothetical protein SGI74_06725 [Oligoflexia bacterium]|nr:hypothetical protein [Oligoflexia bacterium]